MPAFEYKATDQDGKLITNIIVASSKKEAEGLIRDKGLALLVLKEEKEQKPFLGIIKKGSFPLQEKISLCRNLAFLIEAGVPLGDAFELLAQTSKNKTVKMVLQDLALSLRQGQTVSSGFAKYPNYFGEIFLVMIKTGEASGTLTKSFSYLAKEFKQESGLRQEVLNALLYPIVVVSLMAGVGFLMLTFVLPRLAKAFLHLKIELPLMTRFLFETSLFLEKNLLWLFVFSIVFIAGIYLFLKSKKGKMFFYLLGVRLPISRKFLEEYDLARFTQVLSTLLETGVPITQSLEIATKALINPHKEELAKRFQDKVSSGVSLAGMFMDEKIFPPMICQIVSVGEKAGNLDELLVDLSSFYQEEIENSLKNLVVILEPVLMIIIGIAVGVMVLSVITPIYSIISKLQVR